MLNINNEVITNKIIAFEPNENESIYSDEINNIFFHYFKKNMNYDEFLSYVIDTIELSFKAGVMRGQGAI